MALALFDHVIAPEASASSTNSWIAPWVDGGAPYDAGSAPDLDPLPTVSAMTNLAGSGPHTALGPANAAVMASWHTDFHHRFWVVPSRLNLSNPAIDVGVPFRMWNTFSHPGVLARTTVEGSSVLSFDHVAGDIIRAGEYLLVHMEIARGEPTISAVVDFEHDIGTARLYVLAIIAETLFILPEVPVNEEWRFQTDVLTNYLGEETRLSLMKEPRLELSFQVRVVDFEERRALYGLSSSSIKVASVVPLFQYAAPVTAETRAGSARLYFDPELCNARIGRTLIAMNRVTGGVQFGAAEALHSDGATLNTAVGVDVTPDMWFVVPAILCFLNDDSGLDFGTQAGTYTLTARSVETWDLRRPGANAAITMFDEMPVIERTFLITEPERFQYRRELLDNSIGAQVIRSRDAHFVVRRAVKFSVSRTNGDLDYWRDFFSLIRGAQKPFLLSTQLPDLTLRQQHSDGAGTLDIRQEYYETKLYPLDAFRRLVVEYTDGVSTYHRITNSVTDSVRRTAITLSPALAPGKRLARASFLQRVRAADTVRLEHYNDYSYLGFGVRTTNV